MVNKIIVPYVDVNETELTVEEILVEDGQKVEKGELIAILEGIKSVVEVYAPSSGYILLMVDIGKTVFPTQTIGYVFENREDYDKYVKQNELAKTTLNEAAEEVKKPEFSLTHKASSLLEKVGIPPEFVATKLGLSLITEDDVKLYIKHLYEKVNQRKFKYDVERVVIIGAGAGAGVVYDILIGTGREVVGMVGKPRKDIVMPPLEVLSFSDESFLKVDRNMFDTLIISIGFPRMDLRKKLYVFYKEKGYEFTNAIHPTVSIGRDVRIGEGNVISPRSAIGYGSIIGSNNWFGGGVNIDHHNNIGSHNLISPGVTTAGLVSIGNEVRIGMGVNILAKVSVKDKSTIASGIVIEKDVMENEHVR